MYCSNCGAEIQREGVKFCGVCGFGLSASEVARRGRRRWLLLSITCAALIGSGVVGVIVWLWEPNSGPQVWVLSDADQTSGAPGDTLTLLNDSGGVIREVPGFDLTQTIGAPRALTASPDGQHMIVAEVGSGGRLLSYNREGDLEWSSAPPKPDWSFGAIDTSVNGSAYAIADDGNLYEGGSVVQIDLQDGTLLNQVDVNAFDLVVDDAHNGIWLVGADIKRLDLRTLRIESELDPIAWAANSVDVAPDGSVWVTEGEHPNVEGSQNRLLHIAPDGSVIQSVPLESSATVVRVRNEDQSVWVGTVAGIDIYSRTGIATRRIAVGVFDIDINQDDGTVWVSSPPVVTQYSGEGEELASIGVPFARSATYIEVQP